jgi:formate/nitrite transporter FocA (FNT family)
MKKALADFVYAVFAGMSIALGGVVFLSLDNKVLGALFFTVGLFTVCVNGFNLFTGKVGYLFENKPTYLLFLLNVWLGNLLGTFLVANLLRLTRIGSAFGEKAAALCATKLTDSPLSIFVLAIFCNVLMYIAVDGFKNNSHEFGKYLGLFFGVSVFILCGFEHCVANMFYFSMAGVWDLHTFVWLLIMTAGNMVGGVILPLGRLFYSQKPNSTPS